MKTVIELKQSMLSGSYAAKLSWLYGCEENSTEHYAKRYVHVLDGLNESFGSHETAAFFSAPGRTEIGGNHTDHQHGCVLAGAVNIDMIAAVAPNDLGLVRLQSEGYSAISVDLQQLQKVDAEENTSAAIFPMVNVLPHRAAVINNANLAIVFCFIYS